MNSTAWLKFAGVPDDDEPARHVTLPADMYALLTLHAAGVGVSTDDFAESLIGIMLMQIEARTPHG